MFRRKPKARVAEAFFPADLKQLGLFINDKGAIRQIEKPEEKFEYFYHGKSGKLDQSNPKQRLNERRREAIDECIRQDTLRRLNALGITPHSLPLNTTNTQPHVKYLSTRNIHDAKRILFIAPETHTSALGVLSLREATDNSIATGSMETLCNTALKTGLYDGILIANPACLLWDPISHSALSQVSFRARDRTEVAAHNRNPTVLDEDAYRIPGHETPEAHITSLLDYARNHLLSKTHEYKIDFLCSGYSAYCVVLYFGKHWDDWQEHAHAGVLCESPHLLSEVPENDFRRFMAERCRAYTCHAEPVGTIMKNDARFGLARFSSGEILSGGIIPACLERIMGYFEAGWKAGDDKARWDQINPEIPVVFGEDVGEGAGYQEWLDGLRKLDLGRVEPGWDVDGSDKVNELRKKANMDTTDGWGEVTKAENEWRKPGEDLWGVPNEVKPEDVGVSAASAASAAEVKPEDVGLPKTLAAEDIKPENVELPATPAV